MKNRTIGKLERAFFTITILVLVFLFSAAVNKSKAFLLVAVPLYIAWGVLAFAVMEMRIKRKNKAEWRKAQERALKIIKENLTQEFSVVHPTSKSVRDYEYCGVVFKARWDEGNQVAIVAIVNGSDGKIHSETRFDNYVLFVLEYIDKEFKYFGNK